jgi:3-hydroxyisobutyrate dehydrogenase-like beta-hydroxyacid dehydrogenase
MLPEITVLGLGQMGLPVAAAFAAAGYSVWGHDTRAERQALAAQHGVLALGAWASSARTEFSGTQKLPASPWLVTVLSDDQTFAAALFGTRASTSLAGQAETTAGSTQSVPHDDPEAWLERLPAGAVHLCLGTLGVAQAQAAAAAHLARGQHFIATPVFGRPDEAWARDLTALFGPTPGLPDNLRAQAQALLACVAQRIHSVDSPAAACAMKLAGNLMIASAIATMTEAFLMAQAHGAPAALMHEVVTGKLFKGPVFEGVGRSVARACSDATPASAEPGFTVQLGLKDLTLYQQAAEAAGCQMPIGHAVQLRLAEAESLGHGHRDWAELPATSHPHTKEPT